jgi:TolA-binding protein
MFVRSRAFRTMPHFFMIPAFAMAVGATLLISSFEVTQAQTLQELEAQRKKLERTQDRSKKVSHIRKLEKQIDKLDRQIEAAKRKEGVKEPTNARIRALEKQLNRIDRKENKVRTVKEFKKLERQEQKLEKRIQAERSRLGSANSAPSSVIGQASKPALAPSLNNQRPVGTPSGFGRPAPR